MYPCEYNNYSMVLHDRILTHTASCAFDFGPIACGSVTLSCRSGSPTYQFLSHPCVPLSYALTKLIFKAVTLAGFYVVIHWRDARLARRMWAGTTACGCTGNLWQLANRRVRTGRGTFHSLLRWREGQRSYIQVIVQYVGYLLLLDGQLESSG